MAIHGHGRLGNRSYPLRNDSSIQISPDNDDGFDFNFTCPKLNHSLSLGDPSLESCYDDSPADRLFLNGVLLPHRFPAPLDNTHDRHHWHHLMMSGTSSTRSSKGSGSSSLTVSASSSSLASSRSSSSNSESSHSSTARARRGTISHHNRGRLTQSQRWQVIATPVPGIGMRVTPDATHKRRKQKSVGMEETAASQRRKEVEDRPNKSKKSEGLFQALLSTCKRCHALEVPRKDDVLGRNITEKPR